MQKEFYQDKLYPIQDKVFVVMRKSKTNFYLTGGTALSRFYLNHRYSDDLYFFVNRDIDFQANSDRFLNNAHESFNSVTIEIKSGDFVRIVIEDNSVTLRVELINDVGSHYNGFLDNVCRIDNWQNILSNKLCALSRDSSKDFADILFLAIKFNFNWVDVIEQAKQKDTWVNELEIAGLIDGFDIHRLSGIKWIKEDFDYNSYSSYFNLIAKDILKGSDNTLCSLNEKKAIV